MSARLLYLDTSVKLVTPESETHALRRHLRAWSLHVSASLLRTEAVRAAAPQNRQRLADTRRLLRSLSLIDLDRGLLDRAGALAPVALRSLDAVRLAAALSLGKDL